MKAKPEKDGARIRTVVGSKFFFVCMLLSTSLFLLCFDKVDFSR